MQRLVDGRIDPPHVNTKRTIDALKRGKRFYDAFQRVSSMKRIEMQLENFWNASERSFWTQRVQT